MSALAPLITYPPELPVSARREDIARAIRDHQVVIVAGATGSGKTTQLPKICLELGRERIAHTQPRRLAARTIAERISEELDVPLGGIVGYKVRFTDKVTDDTRVTLMTDGILLNEIHRDRLLRRYDTIIIDEAHERSLNVDFLLGYLRRILPQRPDLKVIITSATIDPEAFARHFAAPGGEDAPIIEVSGRTYPVEIRYRGPEDEDADDVDAIVAALRELDRESKGDVLVFLPGEAEIRDAADAVRGAYAKDAAPDRGAAPLRAAERGGAAPGLRTVEGRGRPAPGRARDERRRDEPDRARHPVRHRHRHGAHLALQQPVQGAAAAHRADLAGVGAAALRARRPHERRHRDPPVLRGGLRPPPRVHRARDPAHEPGLRHPADARPGLRRHHGVPLPHAPRLARRQGRVRPAHGARRRVDRPVPERAQRDEGRPASRTSAASSPASRWTRASRG